MSKFFSIIFFEVKFFSNSFRKLIFRLLVLNFLLYANGGMCAFKSVFPPREFPTQLS